LFQAQGALEEQLLVVIAQREEEMKRAEVAEAGLVTLKIDLERQVQEKDDHCAQAVEASEKHTNVQQVRRMGPRVEF
jgi:hypothetical protein